MVDPSTVEYEVELLTETGQFYLLNGVLTNLQWEEQKNEPAQRATLTLASNTADVAGLCKPNCVIYIYSKWGGERRLVFEGIIWEWQYRNQSEVHITAYDRLIFLKQSKDFRYYSAGMSTRGIISDICAAWSVPLAYTWSVDVTHGKKVVNGERLIDAIVGLLEEARKKQGGQYAILYRDGRLEIGDRGGNETVYRFESSMSDTVKISMGNLVTRVKVLGKPDSDGRAAVEATLDGDTRFGVLQEIIRRSGETTVGEARSEGETLLKERGKPEEDIRIDVPDLPFVRKGDRVELAFGHLNGFFCVAGITHDATDRRMALTLERL